MSSNPPPLPSLAKKILAFMIRWVFKPSLSFPVASFPTTDLKGGQLFSMVWEVIEALELDNFPIVAVTADMEHLLTGDFTASIVKRSEVLSLSKPKILMPIEICTIFTIHHRPPETLSVTYSFTLSNPELQASNHSY